MEIISSSKNRMTMTEKHTGEHHRPDGRGKAAEDMTPLEKIKFSSSRFGELEVSHDKIIFFPQGVLGFPDSRRFIVLDYEGDVPFKYLQSVDEPDIAFIITDPLILKPDYRARFKENDLTEIGKPQASESVLAVILTLPGDDPSTMTANLMAPLVINSSSMSGKQIILQDQGYPIKYPVFG